MIYFCEFDDEEEEVEDCPAPPCPNPRNNKFENFQKEFQKSIFSSQLIMIIVMLKLIMRRRKLMVTLRMKGPFVHR